MLNLRCSLVFDQQDETRNASNGRSQTLPLLSDNCELHSFLLFVCVFIAGLQLPSLLQSLTTESFSHFGTWFLVARELKEVNCQQLGHKGSILVVICLFLLVLAFSIAYDLLTASQACAATFCTGSTHSS